MLHLCCNLLVCFIRQLAMFPRWSRALNHLSRVRPIRNVEVRDEFSVFSHRSYAKAAAAAAAAVAPDYAGNDLSGRPAVGTEVLLVFICMRGVIA